MGKTPDMQRYPPINFNGSLDVSTTARFEFSTLQAFQKTMTFPATRRVQWNHYFSFSAPRLYILIRIKKGLYGANDLPRWCRQNGMSGLEGSISKSDYNNCHIPHSINPNNDSSMGAPGPTMLCTSLAVFVTRHSWHKRSMAKVP